jgi:XrtJ-associated TM-motif-TM protein
MKKAILSLALALPLFLAFPAHAQTCPDGGSPPCGCVDSPENPTLVLAGLAGGVFAVSVLRTRLRARRGSRQK